MRYTDDAEEVSMEILIEFGRYWIARDIIDHKSPMSYLVKRVYEQVLRLDLFNKDFNNLTWPMWWREHILAIRRGEL